MPDEFHDDEILLTSYETPSFPLLVMSAKLIVFNIMKSFMKSPLTGLTWKTTQSQSLLSTKDPRRDLQPSWRSALWSALAAVDCCNRKGGKVEPSPPIQAAACFKPVRVIELSPTDMIELAWRLVLRNFSTLPLTSNLRTYVWNIKCN